MESPDTLRDEELYSSLKSLALAFIREHGGRRATAAELVSKLDTGISASDEEIRRAAERLRQQNFLRSEDHTPSVAPAPVATAVSGVQRSYIRDLLVPELLPDSDDSLDEDSKEYKRYQDQWDLILKEEHANDLPEWIVDAYRVQAQELAHRSTIATAKHVGIYLAVNTGLTAIWVTSGMGFPWIVFPVFGWLMGLSSDIASTICRRRHADTLTGSKRPSARHLPVLRTRQKAERKHLKEVIVNPVVIGGLIVFNLATTSFPWAIFPGVAIGIGTLGNIWSLRKQQRGTTKRLANAGYEIEQKKPWWRRIFGSSQSPESVQIEAPAGAVSQSKAQALAAEVRAQLDRIGGTSDTHQEIRQTVDECARVIDELERKHHELSALLADMNREDLVREREELSGRLEASTDPFLTDEYQKAIDGIDRQVAGIKVLQREREVVSLRLQSATGSLKQLRVDLARIQHAGSSEELNAAREIDERTREMSAYLRDLGSAYQDMNTTT